MAFRWLCVCGAAGANLRTEWAAIQAALAHAAEGSDGSDHVWTAERQMGRR
jgi:hypothetical protein